MRSLEEILQEVKSRKGEFYVYILHRPNGDPFYVGCGKVKQRGLFTQRIAFHEKDARSSSQSHKCNAIREIWRNGAIVLYSISGWFKSEPEMFDEEIALIKSIGRRDIGLGPLTNWSDGGDGLVNRSEEAIRRSSKSMLALVDAEFSKRMSLTTKRSWDDPASRQRRMAASASPETKKLRSEASKLTNSRPEVKSSKRQKGLALWSDPEYLARQRAAHLASITDEMKDKLSKATKARWSNPEYRERLRQSHLRRWAAKRQQGV